MNKSKTFLILLLLSPFFWWNKNNVGNFISEWVNFPKLVGRNVSVMFAGDKLDKLMEVRWNAFGEEREEMISKIYYNKGYLILDNMFSYLSYLNPRYYFQSGDSSKYTPVGVEPIAGILFFAWIFGLLKLVKSKKYKVIIYAAVFALIAFLAGQRTVVFLFPVFVIYLYISTLSLNRKHLMFLFPYMIFVIGRVIWLI